MHPALMLDRLDLACTRAAMRDDRTATAQDVAHDEKEEAIPHFDGDLAIKQLGKRVIGQDQAIEGIVSRLTLTRANLDIQPVRPDGVFLFVGPTGVGKTELARALAETVYGTEDACIRLDMSEYAHDWALSRLLGPQPGYVGYTEPEGWLTTQVRERPQSLILLDEVEKAHPTIWNAFLQVFDAGRLTDARGNVAIFSDSIVIMTSNLGSENFRSNPIGFSADLDGGSEQKAGQTIDAVKGAMPPELINRLDDVIVFNALSREVIKMIASSSISTALQRLKSNGFDLTCTDEAIEFIADQGYDPAYGARHLQRNIERHLLQSLVKHGPGRLEAVLNEGAIEWVTVEM
jgi:ATP-dependent Clp protease ATP-binding subunit ClpA